MDCSGTDRTGLRSTKINVGLLGHRMDHSILGLPLSRLTNSRWENFAFGLFRNRLDRLQVDTNQRWTPQASHGSFYCRVAIKSVFQRSGPLAVAVGRTTPGTIPFFFLKAQTGCVPLPHWTRSRMLAIYNTNAIGCLSGMFH